MNLNDPWNPDDRGPSELTDPDALSFPSYGLREPWEEDHSEIPATDDDTIALINDAVRSLVTIRAPFELNDLPTISVLVSLANEANSRLPDAVANARDCGYCWNAIAIRLGTTAASARRRYSAHTQHRRNLPSTD